MFAALKSYLVYLVRACSVCLSVFPGYISFFSCSSFYLTYSSVSMSLVLLSWALVKILCVYFPFGIDGGMWDVIVLIPDHCLSVAL